MSEQDLESLLEAIARVRAEIETEEQARAMLRAEGYLDEKNEVAEVFKVNAL